MTMDGSPDVSTADAELTETERRLADDSELTARVERAMTDRSSLVGRGRPVRKDDA